MRVRRALVAIVACAVLGGVFSPGASAYNRYEFLDETASWLAMRPVEVHCLTKEEALSDFVILMGASGYVEGQYDRKGQWHPGKTTVFDHGICENLLALKDGNLEGRLVAEVAWALLVITHESGHLRGHRWGADEAKTECWAVRHVSYVIDRFGVTNADSKRLLMAYVLFWHRKLPAEYRLRECVLPKA